ncbi:PadR family transcriptional regulator [Embleya sp. NPDC001921]
MRTERPTRGALRSHIVRLTAARGSAHGASLLRHLTEHGYDVTPGMLYPVLRRLETEGLLASERQVVEGTTRRVYRLTAKAEATFEEDRRRLEEALHEALSTQPLPR